MKTEEIRNISMYFSTVFTRGKSFGHGTKHLLVSGLNHGYK